MVAEVRALLGTPKIIEGEQIEGTTEGLSVEKTRVEHQRAGEVDAPHMPPLAKEERPVHSSTSREIGFLAQRMALDGIKPAPIPETPRVQIREKLHGHLVADPHRWLEHPFEQSQRVIPHQEHKIRSWIDAQNARTSQFIGQDKELQNYLQARYYEMQDRPMMRRPRSVANLGTIQWRRDSAA